MNDSPPVIVWIRNCLRIEDNAALYNAQKLMLPIIPIFIFDSEIAGDYNYGLASLIWLYFSLQSFSKNLKNMGLNLIFRRGNAVDIIKDIAKKTGAKHVYCNRNYEPWAQKQERELYEELQKNDITLKRFGGGLLIEPENIKNQKGENFKIFTPFMKALRNSDKLRQPLPKPENLIGYDKKLDCDDINDWELLPKTPDWATPIISQWEIGEQAALKKLDKFINDDVHYYANNRNKIDIDGTSLLSPHIRFGEISPATIWHKLINARQNIINFSETQFLNQIGWREFSYNLLINYPDMMDRPIIKDFEDFAWKADKSSFDKWAKGETGYPLVDAGMRQLWQTGFMHNRVRMIVASFW